MRRPLLADGASLSAPPQPYCTETLPADARVETRHRRNCGMRLSRRRQARDLVRSYRHLLAGDIRDRPRSFLDFSANGGLRVSMTPQILGYGLLGIALMLIIQVLIPTIDNCLQCHNRSATSAHSNCLTCHNYHDRSQEQPARSVTPDALKALLQRAKP